VCGYFANRHGQFVKDGSAMDDGGAIWWIFGIRPWSTIDNIATKY